MISSKKLIKMTRKWQKLVAISQKRITFLRIKEGVDDLDNCRCNRSSTVEKGHFVVYTADQRHFVIPLACLNKSIFRELLKLAEEEYGMPSNGPIILPCDAVFMEHAVSLERRRATKDMENALPMSIVTSRCLSSSNLQQGQSNQQLLIYSF